MDIEPRDVEAIFNAALQRGAVEERVAYLDDACGDHAGLRARVEALLVAHDEAGSFLDKPALDQAALMDDPAASCEGPGTFIGRYKLLQLIGEGGFGSVYMAEQAEPVRRTVALKVIKLGMDTRQVIARFEMERQALALMNHPNIAGVFDGGATDTGRPYFVMELVKGVSITEYCNTNSLSTKERLGLFIPVCNAVLHAHQKGVVHRDIKPSNVMVTLHDGKPAPKVIDFGIAKAIHLRLTEKTFHTEFQQFIGTPEYMSPEQAQMGGLDIDTRSDIYSLGVLLYELLAGTTPFDPRTLRGASYAEIQRIIREEEPLKPSTRLNRLGEASIPVAKNHHTDPRSLTRELRGDLDWITMKCLQKDRGRRYAGVAELAADISRHLTHEPVLAGPPSVVYRFRKFVRRNRSLVGSVAAVFVALAAGVVVSARFAIQATRARDEAERQTAIASEVNDFLNNDLLTAVDPSIARGREVTVREVLDKASEAIEGKFEGKPLVEASTRATLGAVYFSLGDYAQAEPHVQRALALRRTHFGQEHPSTLGSMRGLAALYCAQARYDEAEPLYFKTLELSRRTLGQEHPDTLTSMDMLAVVYNKQGRFDEAEELFVRALEARVRVIGEEHGDTLTSMSHLAALYQRQRRFQEVEPLLVRTLQLRRRVLGEEHPQTLNSMNNLAVLYKSQGRFDDAEPLYRETLEMCRRVLGEEHPDTLISMNNLAALYEKSRRYPAAEPLYLQALQLSRRTLGEEHRLTLSIMQSLAVHFKNVGRYDRAESLSTAAVAGARSSLPEGHWEIGEHLGKYGALMTKLERYANAEAALLESYELLVPTIGATHKRTIKTIKSIVELYDIWDKSDKAAKWRAKLPSVEPPSPQVSQEVVTPTAGVD